MTSEATAVKRSRQQGDEEDNDDAIQWKANETDLRKLAKFPSPEQWLRCMTQEMEEPQGEEENAVNDVLNKYNNESSNSTALRSTTCPEF